IARRRLRAHACVRSKRILSQHLWEEKYMADTEGPKPNEQSINRRNILLASTAIAAVGMAGGAIQVAQAQAQTTAPAGKRPNILVIFGDDIGMWNVSAYNNGMMGWTPNIDRVGKEGIIFTDHYGQPSCTAGRAAFIMGQLPVRTGMTTV